MLTNLVRLRAALGNPVQLVEPEPKPGITAYRSARDEVLIRGRAASSVTIFGYRFDFERGSRKHVIRLAVTAPSGDSRSLSLRQSRWLVETLDELNDGKALSEVSVPFPAHTLCPY